MKRERHLPPLRHPLKPIKHAGVIIALLLVYSLNAAAVTPLNQETSYVNLTPEMGFLEDPNNALTFSDILNMDRGQFTRIQANESNKGISTSIYWLKLTLHANYSQTDKTWVLEHVSPLADQITLFIPTSKNQYSVMENGDSLPFNDRPFKFTNTSFQFKLTPQSQNDIYIRISSRSGLALAFKLRSEAAFNAYARPFYVLNGSYYGMLGIMLIYNLFLYFSIKEKTYFVYTLHILFFGIFMTALDGFGSQFLWPNTTWASSNGLLLAACLSVFFILLFTKVALQTHKFSPLSDRILKIYFLLLAIICPTAIIIHTPLVLKIFSLLMAVFCISVFFVSVRVYFAGNKSARFFILAWGVFSLSLFLSTGSIAGVIPNTEFTAYYQKIGSFLEILLLSFALADRIRTLTNEKSYLGHKTKLILKSSNAYLERTNLMKHEFLATISHELRTPMNGVEGALELMHDEKNPLRQQEYLAIAKRSSAQMIKMIDDILLFTEIQSGGVKARNTEINLSEFIAKLCEPYKIGCEEKSIQFQYIAPEINPHQIIADPMILEHILGPILDNAVRFTHHGSVIFQLIIHDSEHNSEQTPEHNSKHDSQFDFIINDSGPGIEKNRTKEIMQAFTQLDGSHSREFGGLGVGLSMSRQLAHTIGGQLTVQSTLGEGSSFTVSTKLSVIDPPPQEEAAPSTMAVNQTEFDPSADSTAEIPENNLILIAEDNPVNQLVIKKLVQGMGYQIITANDGKEAVELLSTQPINLILMDCQMPVMDGYQATEAVRAMSAPLSDIPIIAVTANVMTEDQQRCFVVGMNDYIKKPINKALLQERIRYWLSPASKNASQAS
ncbi:MAG: hypothetical protein COB04_11755 [Gammaproteobacteria bacterium]|nr:MAG: hypothetical protein COB04_11755 [Gammaproteobacteria bacterium]